MITKNEIFDMIKGIEYPDFKEVCGGIRITKTKKNGKNEIIIEVKIKNGENETTTRFAIWEGFDTTQIYIKNGVVNFEEALPAFNKLAVFLGVNTKNEVITKYQDKIVKVVPEEIKTELAMLKGKVEVYDEVLKKRTITLNQ